ncbi:adhesion G protein-coupled receptor E3-like isoform X2 [Stegostoma tigrinum]|uniref:adhesion G protein-coupled receptor E3-like isoform X2 n=1 Tax=Stegostoma tigrinum TaxID=3053191 RepID=UPI00202AE6A4|nr:adhesion G protein-coupled receptor E3-like isoform X2 [Stegostoma tigrinum]
MRKWHVCLWERAKHVQNSEKLERIKHFSMCGLNFLVFVWIQYAVHSASSEHVPLSDTFDELLKDSEVYSSSSGDSLFEQPSSFDRDDELLMDSEFYSSSSGDSFFDNADLDSMCGLHAQYFKADGGHYCMCEEGYTSTSGELIFHSPTECRRNVSKVLEETRNLDTFILQLSQEDLQKMSVVEIANLTERIVSMPQWESMEPETKHTAASKLLRTTSSSMMAVALNKPNGTLTTSTESLGLKIQVHHGDTSANERLMLNVRSNNMELYWRTVIGQNYSGIAAVGFFAYSNLGSILDGDFVDEEYGKRQKMGKNYWINSDVVTVTAANMLKTRLREPVNFTLRHNEEVTSQRIPVCVHWENSKKRSFWSPRGCKVLTFSQNSTTCGCLHLANFAVLMSPAEMKDEYALHLITLVGVSLSLICLAISIITFALGRSIQSETRTIHLNLSISLFLAILLFIMGISRTGHKVVCAIIAGTLHYLFLAAFAWMFLEGLHLFLIVRDLRKVKVSQKTVIRNVHMYTVGYVLPAVVLGISAAINPNGFGTSQHCWLQLEKGFIWSFLGPVCFIIVVNTILLISILLILQKQLSGLNTKVSKIKDKRER